MDYSPLAEGIGGGREDARVERRHDVLDKQLVKSIRHVRNEACRDVTQDGNMHKADKELDAVEDLLLEVIVVCILGRFVVVLLGLNGLRRVRSK